MSDDLTTEAALAAGKGAAKRALEDLLSTDEEKAEREAAAKSRRTKLIVYGVVGLLVAIGVVGMVLSYWQWFFLLGIAGLVGLYGWHRVRKYLAARKESKPEPVEIGARARIEAAPELESAGEQEPIVIDEQAIEDELAAMKARLKK